jgi:hypothetical protein
MVEVKIIDEDIPEKCDRVGALLVFSPGIKAKEVMRDLQSIVGVGRLPALETADVHRYDGEQGDPVFHIS